MGARANLVIIENSERTLYYDHWCANRLDEELFWGPKFAVDFARQLEPVDDSMWLDNIWCEGAAVIDIDTRTLIFFGGEDLMYEVPRRQAFLELMKRTWRGWVIRWADEGIMSIADYLSMPRERFVGQRGVELEPLEYRDDYPELNDLLLTQALPDGVLEVNWLYGYPASLEFGASELESTLARSPALSLPVQVHKIPRAGVHIDHRASTISCWSVYPDADAVRAMHTGWPGWNVRWWKDHFEAHAGAVHHAILFPLHDHAVIQTEISQSLHHYLHSENAGNPALQVAEFFGPSTEVNPATNLTREVSDHTAKLDIWKDLFGK